MNKHLYMIMDGRAMFDIDRASVMECLGNDKPNIKKLKKEYKDYDAVLVCYDCDGKNNINNPVVICHLGE